MNSDLTATESRLRILLDMVAQQRDDRCREILQLAQKEADALRKEAEREAENRVKQAAREARRQGQQSLDNARAHLDTARWQRHLRHQADLLGEGRALLHQELLRRWGEEGPRRWWIVSLARRCAAVLPAGPLTIRHPPGWSSAEWLATGEGAERLTPVSFEPDVQIAAGLLLCRGGTCVDGTLTGLAGEGPRVDALLLAMLALDPAPPTVETPISNPRGDTP